MDTRSELIHFPSPDEVERELNSRAWMTAMHAHHLKVVNELVSVIEANQERLVEYSSVLGLAESACNPNSLPYNLKKAKIGGDLQLITNSRVIKQYKRDQPAPSEQDDRTKG